MNEGAEPMETTNYYNNVTRLCAHKGISITALAKELGLSKSTPTDWKRKGAQPQAKTLKAVADYFGVTVDHLLDVPVDYENVDTSAFNQVVWQQLLKAHKYNSKKAIKAYFEYESEQEKDAMLDPERLAIYQNNGGTVGVQGHSHAPVTINDMEHRLSDQEEELLRVFGDLDVMQRAKVLIFAAELREAK